MSESQESSALLIWLAVLGPLFGALIGGGALLLGNHLSGRRQDAADRESRRQQLLFERQRRRVAALEGVVALVLDCARQVGELKALRRSLTIEEASESLEYAAAERSVTLARLSLLSKCVWVEDPPLEGLVDEMAAALKTEDIDDMSRLHALLDVRVAQLLPMFADPAAWLDEVVPDGVTSMIVIDGEGRPFTFDPYPELPLDDRRDLELGRFLHQFAMLEDMVTIVTWGAMGVGPPDGAHVKLPALGRSLDKLRGLAQVRFVPEFAARISTWVDQVREVSLERNRLVHSPWVSGIEEPDETVDDDEVGLHKASLTRIKDRISRTTLNGMRDLRSRSTNLVMEGSDLWFALVDAQELHRAAQVRPNAAQE